MLNGDQDVDLVFSDVVMPGCVSGLDLARCARERHPQLRVLLTSAYSSRLRGKPLPKNVAFLPKPYRASDLAAKIREVI
jgi:two-component SAPR family response regulator